MSVGAAPLRVGVNLTWLVPGVVGGSEDYVVGLLDALAHGPAAGDLRARAEPVLFVNRSFAPVHPRLADAFEVVTAPVSGRAKAVRVAADNTWLPAALARRRLDAVHHLGGVVPFVGARRRRDRARLLCIHDLQPLDLPANFSWVKRRFEAVAIPWSVRHAEVVTTLGDWVAAGVGARFAVPPEHLVVVPPGARRPADTAPDEEFLGRLGVAPQPFVVYPAITYPHKNHLVLVAVLRHLADRHPEVRLVLTGGSAATEGELAAAVAAAGLGERVLRPGRVTGAELAALYRGASAMVFPSRYEGFGLPVLEAMQLGCPVVVADACGLGALVGDAGVVVPPDDPAAWADAIARILDDGAWRAGLVEAGRRRAAAFTWEAGASALVGAWERAVALAGAGEGAA